MADLHQDNDRDWGARAGEARERYLRIEPFDGTVTVTFSDAMIASSDRALILYETGHEPVAYVPFDDIYFEFLEKTDSHSSCPLKGTATYWRVTAVGEAAEDFMWAYEAPFSEAAPIAGHGAFDKRRARIELVPSNPTAEPLSL